MDVSVEAIRTGTYLCALSDKENIAYMLTQLARAYNAKYTHSSNDYFTQRVVNKILDNLPNFADALVLELNLIQDFGEKLKDQYGMRAIDLIAKRHADMWKVINKLDSLGFTQPTLEQYNEKIKEGKKWLENQRKK